MESRTESPYQEISEIKKKLSDIHNDLKRLIEHSNQQHIDSVFTGLHRDYSNAIVGYLNMDIDEGLEKTMVRRCDMRKTCKSAFSGFLKKNANLIKQDNLSDDLIMRNRTELSDMKSGAPYEQCEKCFSQVETLLGKQMDLMRSLRIYNTNEEKKQDISALPEESIVNDILEPLSSKQRMQILKAISIETKTFTALSELTGLRGGNLLFHLQKLLDSGMILQRHERGDYMITDKGFKVLKGINDIHSLLGPR